MKRGLPCPETQLFILLCIILVSANNAKPVLPAATNANTLANAQHLAYNRAHAMAQDLENPIIETHSPNHGSGNNVHRGGAKK